MQRYGCFKIRTTCSSCGQSLPINGPYRRLSCTACFENMDVSPDIVAGFLNDFEEEYEGLTEGQGQGGTLMSGSGTFKYSYWRLEPCCSSCRTPFSVPEVMVNPTIRCSKCNAEYHLYVIPDWLRKLVPSARFCCTPQPQTGDTDDKGVEIDEDSTKPIVMSCPQCAGALSVSPRSDRIMECTYCNSEVYIPDAVWQRLHPVRKTEEWFVGFEGKNKIQLQAERRLIDQEEEKKELQKWHRKKTPEKIERKLKSILTVLGIFIALSIPVSVLITLTGNDKQDISDLYSKFAPFFIIPIVILIPLWLAFKGMFSSQTGKGRECKQAIARLAGKHNWKHEGAEYRSSMGCIRVKYRGRDIEIDPDNDYAIEVDASDSPFYIKTEPPGYPHDGVQRFTTGDSRFDSLFPIRYANPELAERIEKSVDEARIVLAPVYWFLDRWQQKLGRFKIGWCDAAVHLAPGHGKMTGSSNKYLLAEDLEPLLEDMIVLAAGIEAIASGREPELL